MMWRRIVRKKLFIKLIVGVGMELLGSLSVVDNDLQVLSVVKS